jgi:RNA polymerase sigma factor (sigma-70 family)
VNEKTDQELLQDYADRQSEAAFAALVHRYVDLVYSVAFRMLSDVHAGRDVTQNVFVELARNARQLAERPTLAGWLHGTARNLAVKTIRSEVRRRAREQEAAVMNELLAANPDADWEHLAPHLDDALSELDDPDRDALLLRYFKNYDLRTVGATLGISDDAAQKRVSRAVERLRGVFAKRGITAGASGLAVVLSANAVQSAPAGLAAAISTAAVGVTALSATTVATATKAIAMTALQKTLITATVVALAGTGLYEVRQNSALRSKVQALQEEHAPLAQQLAMLQSENQRLSNQVVQARDTKALSAAQMSELMKARGKAGVAQADAREIARLKGMLADQSARIPDYLTNAMAMGIANSEKGRMKDVQAKAARMAKALHLSEEQTQAITNIMQSHIKRQGDMMLNAIINRGVMDQQQAMAVDNLSQEEEFKQVLNTDQLAAYPEYKQEEQRASAENSARNEAKRIAEDFSLSPDQQEQIRSSFYEMNLKKSPSKEVLAAAREGSDLGTIANLAMESQKAEIEAKAKILENILSPDQLWLPTEKSSWNNWKPRALR